MRLTLLSIVALMMSACSDGEPEVIQEAGDSRVEIEQARADALAMIEPVVLPEYASKPPVAGSCGDAVCETDRTLFEKRDWPRAWLGDYQAQRNVAYCLGTGCGGAVQIDKSSSCAWRAALIELNLNEATDLDADQLEIECGLLSEVQTQMAMKKSDDIIGKIQAAE